jgi:hypothetical protein
VELPLHHHRRQSSNDGATPSKIPEKNSRLVKFKALELLPGSRSYKCEVVGVPGTVKLSSKALAHVYDYRSRTLVPVNIDTSDGSSGSVGESKSEPSSDCGSSDGEPVDAVQSHFSQLTASEWQSVDTFADQCTRAHRILDKESRRMLRRDVPKPPCDMYLEFVPIELVEHRFDQWVQHAEQSGRRGLSKLDQEMFMRFSCGRGLGMYPGQLGVQWDGWLQVALCSPGHRCLLASTGIVCSTMPQKTANL